MGIFDGTKWQDLSNCGICGQPAAQCRCGPASPVDTSCAPRDATNRPMRARKLRVRVEKRKAKRTVTVVAGLSTENTDARELLARLKAACGAGGTVEEENLVLQGEHRERVMQLLADWGYRVTG